MNDRKPPRRGPSPQVEVIRKPPSAPGPLPSPAPVAPSAPTPAPAAAPPPTPAAASPAVPVAPRAVPVAPRPVPRPTSGVAPRPAPRPFDRPRPSGPAPGAPGSAPAAGPGPGGPPGRSFDRAGGRPGGGRPGGFRPAPRPARPPTEEEVVALAKKEKVPYRIARGDLEGKMKCRVWRKLHAEEAKRFDQAYALMEKHPELQLPDAFALVQSGMSIDELQARRVRTQKKAAVKEARGAVAGAVVDAYLAALIAEKVEVAVVLGDRTVVDVLVQTEPIAFKLERSGRLEKLQVVLMARRALWDPLAPTLERDQKLSQKPLPIVRQPERRPFSDPRAFLSSQGEEIGLTLRNGIRLKMPLVAVGPFDLLVGQPGNEIFLPLHGIARRADQESGGGDEPAEKPAGEPADKA